MHGSTGKSTSTTHHTLVGIYETLYSRINGDLNGRHVLVPLFVVCCIHYRKRENDDKFMSFYSILSEIKELKRSFIYKKNTSFSSNIIQSNRLISFQLERVTAYFSESITLLTPDSNYSQTMNWYHE